LRAEVDPACYKHIQSGRSCEKVNCPKKKGWTILNYSFVNYHWLT
jgi:hypothetical protein